MIVERWLGNVENRGNVGTSRVTWHFEVAADERRLESLELFRSQLAFEFREKPIGSAGDVLVILATGQFRVGIQATEHVNEEANARALREGDDQTGSSPGCRDRSWNDAILEQLGDDAILGEGTLKQLFAVPFRDEVGFGDGR